MLSRLRWNWSRIFRGGTLTEMWDEWGKLLVAKWPALTIVFSVPTRQAIRRRSLQLYGASIRLLNRTYEAIHDALMRWGVIPAIRWAYCPRVLTVVEKSALFGAAFVTLIFVNLVLHGLFAYHAYTSSSWIFFAVAQFLLVSVRLLFTMRSIRLWVSSGGKERPDKQLYKGQLRRKHRPLWYFLRVTWFLLVDEFVKFCSSFSWFVVYALIAIATYLALS